MQRLSKLHRQTNKQGSRRLSESPPTALARPSLPALTTLQELGNQLELCSHTAVRPSVLCQGFLSSPTVLPFLWLLGKSLGFVFGSPPSASSQLSVRLICASRKYVFLGFPRGSWHQSNQYIKFNIDGWNPEVLTTRSPGDSRSQSRRPTLVPKHTGTRVGSIFSQPLGDQPSASWTTGSSSVPASILELSILAQIILTAARIIFQDAKCRVNI